MRFADPRFTIPLLDGLVERGGSGGGTAEGRRDVSTIDPARVQREKVRARQGSVGAGIGVVVGDLIVLAGGAFTGVAMASDILLGGLRDSALNHFFADTPDSSGADIAALPASIMTTLLGMFVVIAAARAWTGGRLSFPVVGPLTIWLAGLAAGLAFGVHRWPAPLTIGVRTDPAFGEDEPWSAVDWALYRAGGWIPWIAVALALASLAVGVVVRRRAAARRRTLDRLLVQGWRARGDVTAIPTLTEGSALVADWTVHFVDRLGTDRWFTSTGRFPRDDLPVRGDLVSVLYDPTAPGDMHRIFVGGLEAVSADDFLRWRL